MAELRRTVSFRAESAPSSGRNGLETHTQRIEVPRTAPVKTRPGILRSPSNAKPAETSANEILQISGQKLSNTPPATKDAPIRTTGAVTSHTTTKNAAELRHATSHKMHEEVKCLRYEASKIREALLKVEEEIKHMSRTKGSLETCIQEIRAGISTNQQSTSIQEKRSRDENPCLKLLRSEMTMLSKCKREVESKLLMVKKCLQEMDQTRRLLHGRLSSSSQNLQLDAQRYMVYDGPVVIRHDSYSRQRHYASSCPQPKRLAVTVDVDLLAKASHVVAESKTQRQQLKGFLSVQQAKKQDMSMKIKEALRNELINSRKHQSEATVKQGQLRMQQNVLKRQQHNEEMALGIAKGPVSTHHRSVSESTDRPLTRLRPESAKEEIENFKETVTTINRKLSSTWNELSGLENPKKTANKQYKLEKCSRELSDKTMKIRLAAAAAENNRWVSGL